MRFNTNQPLTDTSSLPYIDVDDVYDEDEYFAFIEIFINGMINKISKFIDRKISNNLSLILNKAIHYDTDRSTGLITKVEKPSVLFMVNDMCLSLIYDRIPSELSGALASKCVAARIFSKKTKITDIDIKSLYGYDEFSVYVSRLYDINKSVIESRVIESDEFKELISNFYGRLEDLLNDTIENITEGYVKL